MQYVISFLEGIITFISPCLLPMLPIYISYFAGGGERTTRKTLLGALGFVSGFSVIFVAMGALAGTIGSFLREYQTMVNVISGLVVILFGLNFLGIFKWNLFRGGGKTVNSHEMGFFSAMLFGMVFSLGWTPCVGAFLGSALMLASQQGHVIEGIQPQHIGVERCGRCAPAINLFGVIRRGADLERDVIRVLGDAGFGVHHPGDHAIQILRRCAPCRPSVQHLQLDVPKLHRTCHAVGTAGAQRKIRNTGRMKAGQVQRAVLHSYPIPVGSDKVRVR